MRHNGFLRIPPRSEKTGAAAEKNPARRDNAPALPDSFLSFCLTTHTLHHARTALSISISIYLNLIRMVSASRTVTFSTYQFARKERYFSENLKQEKLFYDLERKIAVLMPGREDFFERLLEQNKQFSDPAAETPEDAAMKADLIDRLEQALYTLSDDKWMIIRELFYLEKTERQACASLHIPPSTLPS